MMVYIVSLLSLMLGLTAATTAWMVNHLDQRVRDLEEIWDQQRRR